MSKVIARGACPRLAAPMKTGDGLLARIVPAAPMPLEAFAMLCEMACAHGNGIMEVSARGSLQVRGLTPDSAPLFARAVEALGIGDGVPVIASPLPDDPSALIDAPALASALRQGIGTAGLRFAPKVSVVVDGGGHLHLDTLKADVRLRAISTAERLALLVSLAGDAASAAPLGLVPVSVATDIVLRLLAAIADRGPEARASDVLARGGLEAFRAVAGTCVGAPVPIQARPPAEPIGLHRLKTVGCAMGIALAFGQAEACDLIALIRIAQANGATWAATAPGRALLLGPIDELTGFVLATAADNLGFIVDARDPRRQVVACPGAPFCSSGLIAARALAVEIANALPHAERGTVHVSGCVKGCAHPAPAPLTVVGTESGCGIVHHGTAHDAPARYADANDIVSEIGKAKEAADA